jgi:hypothetical protein
MRSLTDLNLENLVINSAVVLSAIFIEWVIQMKKMSIFIVKVGSIFLFNKSTEMNTYLGMFYIAYMSFI